MLVDSGEKSKSFRFQIRRSCFVVDSSTNIFLIETYYTGSKLLIVSV